MKRRSWRFLLSCIVIGVAIGCANSGGVGGDSETNWLKMCTTDGECTVGSCLCGVCTTSCASGIPFIENAGGSCGGGPPGSTCLESYCAGVSTATNLCFKASTSTSSPLMGPEGGACAATEFRYDDVSCPPPGPGPVDASVSTAQCTSAGDGLCHARCATSADCTDPTRPYCGILGLYAGYDDNCNVGVRICREHPGDDCPKTPSDLR